MTRNQLKTACMLVMKSKLKFRINWQKNNIAIYIAGEFEDLSVPGFHLIQLNRTEIKTNTKRNSGGIALYIKQTLYTYCTLLETQSDDIIWIKINGHLFN